jgi:NADPH-dependent ferric siderophore reductase
MSDSVPAAGAVALNDPFAELRGPLAGTTRMQLEVAENTQLTPHMQRLVLTAPQLTDLSYRPGQDIMLLVAVDGDRPVRRRYTIRDLDTSRRRLTLDIVRHGDGPGERWVRAARPGERIEGIAPRGKIFLAEGADWHLFAADESGLAAVFAMAGSLPARARAIVLLEVPEPADQLELAAQAELSLSWLPRADLPRADLLRAGPDGADPDGAGPDEGSRPAGDPDALAAALEPAARDAEARAPGAGHYYLFGEAKVVLRLREVLAGRGVPAGQISAKAYWGRGKANAQHGEPAKDS